MDVPKPIGEENKKGIGGATRRPSTGMPQCSFVLASSRILAPLAHPTYVPIVLSSHSPLAGSSGVGGEGRNRR